MSGKISLFFLIAGLVGMQPVPVQGQQLRWQWAVQAKSVANNRVSDTACDTSGNIYLTGSFSDTTYFDTLALTPQGGEDIFLLKFNRNGAVSWAKSAGGAGDDYPTAMAVSPSGIIYTAGLHGKDAHFDQEKTGRKTFNLFISRHSPDGTLAWVKSFGAKRSDYITAIAIDSAENIYFGGYFEKKLQFDEQHILTAAGDADAFVACLDSLGQCRWAKQWGSHGADRVSALHVHDTVIWIAGQCAGVMNIDTAAIVPLHDNHTAIFVARSLPNGEITQAYGHISGEAVTANSIVSLANGHPLIGGNFSDSLLLGHTVFEACGNRDMFIAAFDSTGIKWQQQLGSAAYDNLFDVLYHPWGRGHIIVTGLYSAPLLFGEDTVALANPYCDVFTASYNEAGKLQEITVMGGRGEEFPQALTHDSEGHVFVAGLFRDTTHLRKVTLTSPGVKEVFLAKLYHCDKNKIIFSCDTVFVEGNTLNLAVEGQYQMYEWDRGASLSATYEVVCSKTYQVRVEDSLQCVYRDSIVIKQAPEAPKVQIRAHLPDEKPLYGTNEFARHRNKYFFKKHPRFSSRAIFVLLSYPFVRTYSARSGRLRA
jgi:hypothetical protein